MSVPEISYAKGLLPTLPGYARGIVGIAPWRIQCDGCGAIEVILHGVGLVLMRTVFLPTLTTHGTRDPRRLCPTCQKEAGWPR